MNLNSFRLLIQDSPMIVFKVDPFIIWCHAEIKRFTSNLFKANYLSKGIRKNIHNICIQILSLTSKRLYILLHLHLEKISFMPLCIKL